MALHTQDPVLTQRDIARAIVDALDHVYITVEDKNDDGDYVIARVDIKPKLTPLLSASAQAQDLARIEHDLLEEATLDDADTAEGATILADSPGVDEWFMDLNGPGTLALDDILLSTQEATTFDLPSMFFATLCVDLATALRIVSSESQKNHLLDYCLARNDDSICAYQLVNEYLTHIRTTP